MSLYIVKLRVLEKDGGKVTGTSLMIKTINFLHTMKFTTISSISLFSS